MDTSAARAPGDPVPVTVDPAVPVPAVPVPDDKDWTWAAVQACADCGFDPTGVGRDQVGPRAVTYTARLGNAALEPDAASRPEAVVWSPLEYAAHARDVCELFDQRLILMLSEDDPEFENWDQDATALAERYWEQDPLVVVDGLSGAARTIAARFAGVRDEQWDRPGRRSNGSRFTVDTIARYLLHDLAHHAWDVTRSRAADERRATVVAQPR